LEGGDKVDILVLGGGVAAKTSAKGWNVFFCDFLQGL
jgi:hypothetical protein